MAYLLLLHQKMSLKRKVNKLTLQQTSIGTRKDRITKRIEKVQKSYAKKQSKLEAQAKRMTSMTNSIMNNQMMAVTQQFQMVTVDSLIEQSIKTELENRYKKYIGMDPNHSDYAQTKKEYEDYLNNEYKNAYQIAQQKQIEQNNAISMQKQWMQQYCNTFTTNYSDLVSIWLETETQKLEDEEEMALAPLNEEDTQIDIEQASNEAQLSYAQARLESIESALSSRTQEAPKFGA